MRILQVSHGYPPDQMAGAEVYTWSVASEQARRGHEVHVLAPGKRAGQPELALLEEQLDGVRVHRLNQNFLGIDRLEKTYTDPDVDAVFAGLLERLKPDVVHVQHTIGVSAGVLRVAERTGVPLVMTLHDFWAHCPRGQRVTPRLHLCEQVEPWRCALCVGRKRAAYFVRWLGEYPKGRVRESRGRSGLSKALGFAPSALSYLASETWSAPILRRSAHMLDALLAADVLLSPSNFLSERYVEQGVPRERLEFSEYGMNDAPFRALAPRAPRDALRKPVKFGFTGTLIPNKGADLLIEAFQKLPVGAATLDIFGAASGPSAAKYESELRALNHHLGVNFRGRFDNRRIAQILSELDVVVVPSRWWENAPLTIHEAVMARMPLVVANHGGMRELAERFGNAALFEPGDVADLERALRRFLDEPAIWDELQPRRAVRSVSDDVDGLLERYERLARGRQ
jgi:glycosyltransferase involved in cell wall biosynthesis